MVLPRSAFFFPSFLFAFIILITISPVEADQVTLAWDANNPTPDGYRIYARSEGSAYNYASPVWSGSANTGTISTLSDNTTYYFTVRAFVGNSESGDSNEVEFTTSGSGTTPPPAPAGDETLVTIDDGDTGTSSSGYWRVSGGADPYGAQSLYSNEYNARYYYTHNLSGRYEVAVWWTEYSTRCSDVPVEIYDGDVLIDTVYVDQRQNGGQWNVLGSYDFTGQARVAIRSQHSSCSSCADAVELSLDTADGNSDTNSDTSNDNSAAILDDGDPGTSSSGSWRVSGGADPYGAQSLYSNEYDARYYYTYNLSGPYEVAVWWTEYSTRCSDVPVEIYDGDVLIDTVYVDQRQNGGQWNVLGSYDFTGQARVAIRSQHSSCSSCADAVELSPGAADRASDTNRINSVAILDDGDTGTSSSGSWRVSGGADPYGAQSLYSNEYNARYFFSSGLSGYGEVAIWWTEYSTRCSAVPVEIYDGDALIDTVYVDQRQNGGQWNVLGSYDFTSQARVAVRSQDNACSSCADAAFFSTYP